MKQHTLRVKKKAPFLVGDQHPSLKYAAWYLVRINGDFSSSVQILHDQSPTLKKYLLFGILLLIAYTGPKWRPYSKPYLPVISIFAFGFLLAIKIPPYSVPINNLLGLIKN